MALTKTDILNKALTLVGAAPITNIDDDTENARVLSRVYDSALRGILSECKWNFATKRALLTVISTSLTASTLAWYDTNTSESYVYQKPNDIIRIFGTNSSTALYREEGEYIISDTSGLGIRYVYYLDSPGKYSFSFIEALIDKVAYEIAFVIVNSGSLAEKYLNKYENISLSKAMSQNSQIGTQQEIRDEAWTDAKYYNTQPEA